MNENCKKIQIGNKTLGEGVPVICVPVVGRTETEILEAAELVKTSPADLVEWRADWYEDCEDTSKVIAMAALLREKIDRPILFTIRTAAEGGEKAITPEAYRELLIQTAKSGQVLAVDVEAFLEEETTALLIRKIHEAGALVIASNHDFHATPSREEIVRRLVRMQEMGADAAKIAVMPNSEEDVLVLLQATQEMKKNHPQTPVITMSMGKIGVVSRICGEVFGSALTFGTAGKASAPGQMGAEELRQVLMLLHAGMGKE